MEILNKLLNKLPHTVAIVLTLILVKCNNDNADLRYQNESLASIAREKSDTISTLINDNGNLVHEKAAAYADVDLLEEHYQEAFREMEEEHGVTKDQLASYKRITSRTTTSGTVKADNANTVTVIENDTTYIYPGISILEPWFEFDGKYFNNSWQYVRTTYDSLSIVDSWEKKGWFLNRSYDLNVSVVNYNPDTQITGITSLTPKPPQAPRFSIGPSITYGIGLANGKPQIVVGVSVQYGLLRF